MTTSWVPAEGETAHEYAAFAEREARGTSPLYEAICRGIAADAELVARLDALPPPKRQPVLVLAAARLVCGLAVDYAGFRERVLARWDDVAAEVLARRTQTNEPGRCASLLPVLAALPQPLALVEAGASAGLCLLPDEYAYDYDGRVVGTGGPVFPCRTSGGVAVPDRVPEVAWRAGLDLNPLDVRDDDAVRWLECLVWPEHAGRAERLRAAVEVARRDPPRVVRGDLAEDLPALAAEAPRDATLVVFHSAVLAYVDAPARERFAATVRELGAAWVSNEAPGVAPGVAVTPPEGRSVFVVARDGVPVGFAGPHGDSLAAAT